MVLFYLFVVCFEFYKKDSYNHISLECYRRTRNNKLKTLWLSLQMTSLTIKPKTKNTHTNIDPHKMRSALHIRSKKRCQVQHIFVRLATFSCVCGGMCCKSVYVDNSVFTNCGNWFSNEGSDYMDKLIVVYSYIGIQGHILNEPSPFFFLFSLKWWLLFIFK